MSDTSIFSFINGLAGKVPFIDEFFKGISNDYFSIISACLILIWLWFATRDPLKREENQRAVIAAMISVGFANVLVIICNHFYYGLRPFEELTSDSVNLLFYRPTDSSFPSNFAAVTFAIATPILIKNFKYGLLLLVLAILSSCGRIYIGVHYPLDVIAGAIVGIITGFLALGTNRLIEPLLNRIFSLLRKFCLA